jgi:deoxycytidine triphosphate deaminase
MHTLPGSEVAQHLAGILHPDTQQHDYEVDLTAGAIFAITGPGAIDFGGSELLPAPREAIQPETTIPEDKYGWWMLDPGSYIVRFNETIQQQPDQIAFIQPHERLLQAGGFHATCHFRDTREHLETLLIVGAGGLRIKENARLSKLLIFRLDG